MFGGSEQEIASPRFSLKASPKDLPQPLQRRGRGAYPDPPKGRKKDKWLAAVYVRCKEDQVGLGVFRSGCKTEYLYLFTPSWQAEDHKGLHCCGGIR